MHRPHLRSSQIGLDQIPVHQSLKRNKLTTHSSNPKACTGLVDLWSSRPKVIYHLPFDSMIRVHSTNTNNTKQKQTELAPDRPRQACSAQQSDFRSFKDAGNGTAHHTQKRSSRKKSRAAQGGNATRVSTRLPCNPCWPSFPASAPSLSSPPRLERFLPPPTPSL